MSDPILTPETKEAIREELQAAAMKPFEQWLEEHPVAAWLLAAAKRKFRWARGREMTLSTFKNAIEETRKHRAKGA